MPAGNTTYTAQWTVNKYTVTFDANGGTGGKSGPILEALRTLRRTVRLCATAVTLESSHQFLELFAPLADFTAFQLSVANLEAAGSLHLYRAQNPVTLFSATLNQ